MARLRFIPLLVLALPLLSGCNLFRRPANRPPYKALRPPVAYEMMRDSPDMLVLDLRPAQEFNGDTGHIRRAQNMPLERLPYRLLEISPYRDHTILIYCRADDCGKNGATILASSGFENVVLIEGGIDSWIRHGYKTVLPVEALGRNPPEGTRPVRPLRPGEEVAPRREVPVEPPPPPPPPPPGG